MEFFNNLRDALQERQISMKQFMSFVRKEFYHIFRDKTTMAILLILPILMLVLFGYSISTEVKNSKIAILDSSNDVATRAIIEKFRNSEYFSVKKMVNNPSEIQDLFKKDRLNMVLVFGDNFYENLAHTGNAQVQLIVDGSDPNSAKTIVTYATSIIGAYQLELSKIDKIPFQINPQIKLLYNPQMKGAYNFVPGVMGMILMLICAMMTSISIAREKELGTMEVLLVSPMKPIYIILSKTIPYFVLSLVNLATILLLSVFLLKVPIAGSLFWLIAFSLVYIFVNLSLGLLISSIVDSQLVALLISGMVLMLPVIMLSGMMFPVENMPVFFQWISQIIPAKWYIIGVKKIMIKGLGLSSIIPEMSVLLGMGIVLVIASLKNFKYRLE
ncbi:MAG: Inner membrane transport permease YbhR [Bacteroidetes bacterium ADurb.BinA395]|jgi:ABC-2 type transport system permease protein|nr:MAG: Inner membrane transport permease YbhR [Bacteroidetes bacterium ADurb.BinA395]